MHDATGLPVRQDGPPLNYSRNSRFAQLHRHYPSIDYLRRRARGHIPHFAFEYADGGSGKDDSGIRRNWNALDAVELIPRYGSCPHCPHAMWNCSGSAIAHRSG
jgi:hypothetical protein